MKQLIIHHNNIPSIESSIHSIEFRVTVNDVDKYISEKMINQIKDANPDIIFIKDNLSSNYLELYGLRVAYHIRLSEKELGVKHLVPIVILSDIDGYTLSKLNPIAARILFTKNVFIEPNNKESIDKYLKKEIQQFEDNEFEKEFLNLIQIEAPENSTSHSIANKWAIDRWAKFLNVENKIAIDENREEISHMLYSKYLVVKHTISETSSLSSCVYPIHSGKVLFIDDEWDKGWGDIFEEYFSSNEKNEFIIYNDNNKDISLKSIDVVILDLRMTEEDHNKDTEIENLTGIKYAQTIKNKNPGIQIIMFTATGSGLILEELYKYGILGYIKKEHPEDKSIKTKESFEKLARLLDEGFEKKYLKDVWEMQKSILGLEIFKSKDDYIIKIKSEIETIFEILDSNLKNKIKFTIFTIFKVLEVLSEEFAKSKKGMYTKFIELCRDVDIEKDEISKLICTRNFLAHSGDISELSKACCADNPDTSKVIEKPNKDNIMVWLRMLQKILVAIETQKKNT